MAGERLERHHHRGRHSSERGLSRLYLERYSARYQGPAGGTSNRAAGSRPIARSTIMSGPPGDPFGSSNKKTQYEGQGRRGARSGKARSGWALVFAALFLVGLAAWILLRPYGGNGLGGSSSNGTSTGSPSNSRFLDRFEYYATIPTR